MIIAQLGGGLCNQLYFFATAYALSREWEEELVLSIEVDGNLEWFYVLDEFQIPDYKKIIPQRRYQVKETFSSVPSCILNTAQQIDETYFEPDGEFLTISKERFEHEFPGKDIYLHGTFLARQMFTKYVDDLRRMIVLREPSKLVQAFERDIQDVTAVGVHIRRQGFSVLGDDNSADFFKAAIVHMRQLYSNARFYIFSDDIDDAKEQLGAAPDIRYMDAMNGFRGDIEEFMCLTKCHHYILTRRSTYGRMAEILNAYEDKVSVLYGKNTWGDSEERFHFLTEEDIQSFLPYYEYEKIKPDFDMSVLSDGEQIMSLSRLISVSLDSAYITSKDRISIIYEKAKIYAKENNYKHAAHLCNLLEDQWGCDDVEFHMFYADVLFHCGRHLEAQVEYVRASKQITLAPEVVTGRIDSENQTLLCDRSKKHYIIVQYGTYNSQYLSRHQTIGLILGRMGHEVSLVLNEDWFDSGEAKDNVTMLNWQKNIDQKWMKHMQKNGFSFCRLRWRYLCYSYSEILQNPKEKLKEIINCFPECEPVIIGDVPEILTTELSCKKIFLDYEKPFDNAYLKAFVDESLRRHMCECADVVVTNDEERLENKSYIDADQELLEADRDYISQKVIYEDVSFYTEDYVDTALKIAR